MKDTTRNAITAILATDETIGDELKEAALGLLSGQATSGDGWGSPVRDRIIKRGEVAKLFGVTTKTVDWMARQPGSILKKVFTSAGSSRACGYSESSVMEAIGTGAAGRGSKYSPEVREPYGMRPSSES